jgi:hypothetical protein
MLLTCVYSDVYSRSSSLISSEAFHHRIVEGGTSKRASNKKSLSMHHLCERDDSPQYSERYSTHGHKANIDLHTEKIAFIEAILIISFIYLLYKSDYPAMLSPVIVVGVFLMQ